MPGCCTLLCDALALPSTPRAIFRVVKFVVGVILWLCFFCGCWREDVGA